MAAATVASIRANWSPTHLRMPPPKGMNAKSDATSLGYSELPCASGLQQPKPKGKFVHGARTLCKCATPHHCTFTLQAHSV